MTGPSTLHQTLLRMRSRAAVAAFENRATELGRLIKAKFEPAQPRVAAGEPGGGQWSGDGSADPEKIIAKVRRMTLAGRSLSYEKCLDSCFPLLERFQLPGSDRNTWDFHKCMNICLGRNK